MKIIKITIINTITLCLLASLTGCKSPYVKAGEVGGFQTSGYNNIMTNGNTAIVTYKADSREPGLTRKYTLYRAAEVTIENGYDYFVVVSSSLSTTNVNLNTKTISKPMYPPTSVPNINAEEQKIKSYSESSTRATQCRNQDMSPCTARSTTMVIKMYKGQVPNIPRAYSALDVIAQYSPAT